MDVTREFFQQMGVTEGDPAIKAWLSGYAVDCEPEDLACDTWEPLEGDGFKAFRRRVTNEGVWGYGLKFNCQPIHETWTWGFVGSDFYGSGYDQELLRFLREKGDREHYWETWESVLENAEYTDESGVRWTLYQDGDLWLIPDHPGFCFGCWVEGGNCYGCRGDNLLEDEEDA